MTQFECFIYVDSALGAAELAQSLTDAAHHGAIGTTIDAPFAKIRVTDNEDFHITDRAKYPDGFLHFARVIEVYPHDDGLDRCKHFVAETLRLLWAAGTPAVAACDYELDLPAGGGYGADGLPWPSLAKT